MVKECDLSRENSILIKSLKENLCGIKKSVDKIESSNKEMFNHFSERYEQMFEKLRNRVPFWMTAATTGLSSILTGIVVYAVSH